jgi:hypothetical protein
MSARQEDEPGFLCDARPAYNILLIANLYSGERTATALENYLTDLESKIEALLKAVENPEQTAASNGTSSTSEAKKPEEPEQQDSKQ